MSSQRTLERTPSQRRIAHCDDGSKVIFHAVHEAVVDVQEEFQAEGVRISPYFQEKLDYSDTDLCLYANAAMREVQYCTSFTKLPGAATAHRRTTWTPQESAYALHSWHRQLRWHQALIQSGPPARDSEHSKGPPKDSECTSAEAHAAKLLREPRFERQESSKLLRDWARNTMSRDGLVEAVRFLVAKGIVTSPDVEQAAAKPRKAFTVAKRTWADVSQNDDAMQLLKRLRVHRDSFDL